MRRFISFSAILGIIFIFLLNLLMTDVIASLDKDLNFSQYLNTKYDFSIKYPSSWNLTELSSKSNENLFNVEIKSEFDGPRDMIQEKFVISINQLPQKIDLNTYVDDALIQLNHTYPDFKLISDKLVKNNTIQSRTISYSYLAGIPPISTKLVMTTEIISYKERVYVLSFGTPPDKYYDILPIMKRLFDSFEILNNNKMISLAHNCQFTYKLL